MLNRKSKTSIVLFYSYETITLKLYLEIVNTLDYKRMISVGQAADIACQKEWEKLIAKNYEINGGFDYLNYVDLMQGYAHLMAEYNIVRASLLKLIAINLEIGVVLFQGSEVFVQDEQCIEDLRTRDYKIKTDNGTEYAESINAAIRKSDNLITRLKMKQNELNDMMSAHDGGSQIASFEEIIANLSFLLGFEVKEDITLSRYNEYKKILKERNKPKSEWER